MAYLGPTMSTRYGSTMVETNALGFTPEQEEVLIRQSAEGEAWRKKQDQVGMAKMVLIGAGIVFTLARLGDLVAQMRRRRSA